MWQIATDKKHGRAIVALDQFLTDHRDYPHALTLALLTFAPALALPTLTLSLLHPLRRGPRRRRPILEDARPDGRQPPGGDEGYWDRGY